MYLSQILSAIAQGFYPEPLLCDPPQGGSASLSQQSTARSAIASPQLD
jgi:hypothetical protein